MSFNNPNKIFRSREKFSQSQVNEIREKISKINGLPRTEELENIVPFREITKLPKRDGMIWFSMYNIAIANKFNDNQSGEFPSIASYYSLISYLNYNAQKLDESFVFSSDIFHILRNKFYIFKLNSSFRKIFGNPVYYNSIKWAPNIPFTKEERIILSFLQSPSSIFNEIAYWKFKTNFRVSLSFVYMMDRISRSLGEIIKKYKNKHQPFSFFGLKKVNKLEYQIYEEIKPILTDLVDFYEELCPIDDRKLPKIEEKYEKIPKYIKIVGSNKSILQEFMW